MSEETSSTVRESTNPLQQSPEQFIRAVHAPPGTVRLMGVVMLILGVLALLLPVAATWGATVFFGILMILYGAGTFSQAFSLKTAMLRIWNVLLGVVGIGVGIWVLVNPVEGMAALTLVIGIVFLVAGVTKMLASIRWRPHRFWGWMFISGLISLLLGILIIQAWPGDALWILGILLGIDLIFLGISMISLSSIVTPVQENETK